MKQIYEYLKMRRIDLGMFVLLGLLLVPVFGGVFHKLNNNPRAIMGGHDIQFDFIFEKFNRHAFENN